LGHRRLLRLRDAASRVPNLRREGGGGPLVGR
jgi:hypothetical protein